MLKTVRGLISAARSQSLTSAELRTALDSARSTLAVAETELADANAAYRDSLLDVEVKQAVGARERVARAEVDRDRGKALVEALAIRLREAEEREAEAQRQATYDAAVAAAEAAREELQEIEPLSKQILEKLGILARAEQLVERANSALPAGAAPLPGVESSVRDRPATPRKVVREKVVELWCNANGQPLPEEKQQKVRGGSSYGVLPPEGMALENTRVHLRPFRRVEFIPGVEAETARPLAATLSLPALKAGEAPLWTPGRIEPEFVLARIAEAKTESPDDAQPKTVVAFEPIDTHAQAAE